MLTLSALLIVEFVLAFGIHITLDAIDCRSVLPRPSFRLVRLTIDLFKLARTATRTELELTVIFSNLIHCLFFDSVALRTSPRKDETRVLLATRLKTVSPKIRFTCSNSAIFRFPLSSNVRRNVFSIPFFNRK